MLYFDCMLRCLAENITQPNHVLNYIVFIIDLFKKDHMDKKKEDEIDKLDTFERPNYRELMSDANRQIEVLENILKLHRKNGGKRIYLGICAFLLQYE